MRGEIAKKWTASARAVFARASVGAKGRLRLGSARSRTAHGRQGTAFGDAQRTSAKLAFSATLCDLAPVVAEA